MQYSKCGYKSKKGYFERRVGHFFDPPNICLMTAFTVHVSTEVKYCEKNETPECRCNFGLMLKNKDINRKGTNEM